MIKKIDWERQQRRWSIVCIVMSGVVAVLAFQVVGIQLKVALFGMAVGVIGLGSTSLRAMISYDLLKGVDSKVDIILSSITKTKKARSTKKGGQK
jgi:hypothetical protein